MKMMPLNHNESFEDMDVDTIDDYIDDKCHNISATIWACQLLFMGKTVDKECKEMDILQFVAAK